MTAQHNSDPSGVAVHCGWGRLIFAHTYPNPRSVAETILKETEGERNIAFYVAEPHLVINVAPHELFLDPSNTYRIDLNKFQPSAQEPLGFTIDTVQSREDLEAINRIYLSHHMVPVDIDKIWNDSADAPYTYFIARSDQENAVIAVAMGIDHMACFEDITNGSSLWALAVDSQAELPGIGRALTERLAQHYQEKGRDCLDLSVMSDNTSATRLYTSLGFERIAAFAVKCRNEINENLFVSEPAWEGFNIYAEIIIKEALRRGIGVEPLDRERGFFRLTMGGRSVVCRESLTELTSAIAVTRCDDKSLTQALLKDAGLSVPNQISHVSMEESAAFLAENGSVVVKPLRGEQGQGISVDVRTPHELEEAILRAQRCDKTVLIEQFVTGVDLRIIVINQQIAAAAIRKPPQITGDGERPIQELIERFSRRRRAASAGEIEVPIDEETERLVQEAGHSMNSILPAGEQITIRKTANLHTGGTIHDVTPQLHPTLAEAAIQAANVLEIPVVGLDFIVPSPDQPEYVVIEANERPGLANHEPQPTAEMFMEFLFPQVVLSDGTARIKA